MSLESILKHIIDEADSKKDILIQQASEQAEVVIQSARQEAEALYQKLIDREKALGLAQQQKLVINARLEAKKNLLKVKQGLIDEVFQKLKPQLGKEKIKKKIVSLDNEQEAFEDVDFYLAGIRLDYESEIAQHLFI